MDFAITQDVELFLGFITFLLSTYIGWSVYKQDRNSWTHRLFGLIAFLIDIYIVVNFLSLHPPLDTPENQLFWIRIVMFVTSFFGPLLFLLVHTFPKREISLKNRSYFLLFGLMITSAVFSLTNLVFEGITYPAGQPIPVPGLGMPIFLLDFPGLFTISFIYLIYRYRKSAGVEKKQLLLFLVGILATFSLMASLTVILVVFFKTSAGVFLGPLVPVILMAFIAYAIVRYALFNVKVFAAKLLVAFITITLFSRIFFSNSVGTLFMDLVVLSSVIIFGNFLVKSVKVEVKQREELAKLAKSLEKANLRLQELDKQKTEFLSIASHQLRTPLSIIKGYIELIEDGAYGKPTKKTIQVLDDMDKSNERLVKLVDEFLDITRIEQGRTKFVYNNSDMNKLIDGIVAELSERAGDKGLKISWKPNKKIKKVYMDEEKIRHVIFNYIDNAIKYSEKGTIKVNFLKEDGGVSVKVKDQGIGFETLDKANFFKKFYRGENVKHSNVNGTGLGIYVCRKFIETHGGHVFTDSSGIGKGSLFGFWIPLKKGEQISPKEGKS